MLVTPGLYSTDQQFGSYTVIHSKETEGKYLCYFSGYTEFPDYPDYVFYFLKRIIEAGFEIIFISSGQIRDNTLERLQKICSVVIQKENKGADFGAWKAGLSLTEYGKKSNMLLFANDSIPGPFFSLKPVLKEFLGNDLDLYGLTASVEGTHHIQSSFLFISYKIFSSDTWQEFWNDLPCYPEKDNIINDYEVEFSKKILSAGFRYGTWFDKQRFSTSDFIRKKVSKNANLYNQWAELFLSADDGRALVDLKRQGNILPGLEPKKVTDISDLRLMESPAEHLPSEGQKTGPPSISFFEILNKYHKEYEALPMWFKKTGQVFKILMGHKILKVQLKNKAIKIHLKHKLTVSEFDKVNSIKNWYHHEYDVLPGWCEKLGKLMNRNK